METDYKRKKMRRSIDRMTYHFSNGIEWFSFPIIDKFEFIVNAFSTRVGGVSEGDAGSLNLSLAREIAMNMGVPIDECRKKVRENHRRLAAAVGYSVDALVFSNQTHTDNIRILTDFDRGNGSVRPNEYHDVDGMMTDIPGQALMTFYADCVPLLLVDPIHRAVANIHSGWRGTVKGIGTRAVKMMREVYGSDPNNLVAAIGPSICRDCYEVSEDVADKIREKYAENLWSELLTSGHTTSSGAQKYYLDLQRACMVNFLQAGMKRKNISLSDLCTSCNKDYLYSHRASHGRRGNQAAVIMLK